MQDFLRNIYRGKSCVAALVRMTLAMAVASPILAQTTTRVSVSSFGVEADASSLYPYISGDGRFVAFISTASNLVADDTNGMEDVFVHDRQTGETTRVSVSSTGEQANGTGASGPVLSHDGRFVTFQSFANNLVDDDTNALLDIFVHDRTTGETTRVSVSSKSEQSNGTSTYPSISPDGRFVAFYSSASNLVPDDSGWSDAFVHDRLTGETVRVSVTLEGVPANANSGPGIATGSPGPALSVDGCAVAFSSNADNLVRSDANGVSDVFMRDCRTREVTRVSIDSAGLEGTGNSGIPSMSADGRLIAFITPSQMVAEDTNSLNDLFVRDVVLNLTTRVSVSSAGDAANAHASTTFKLSQGGRFVVFQHSATNLITGDTNAVSDVFVHDRLSGQCKRVSLTSSHGQANGGSGIPTISADGRFVALQSSGNNIVSGDTNGVTDIFVRDRGACVFAELTDDGAVGVPELLTIINAWGPCLTPRCVQDIAPQPDGDDSIGVLDLLMIINNWGACP